MDFTAFDTKKLDEYANEAKESWGSTKAYKEFEAKNGNKTLSELKQTGEVLMAIVAEFGQMKDRDASDKAVQDQVRKLQAFITEHYYTCTDEILSGLGKLYAGGGEFTKNIDEAGGEGAAEFANKAIQFYCNK